MSFKINFKSVAMYILYAAAAAFANLAVKGVPLSLGLLFSMLICGTNIIATPILYVLASAVNANLYLSLISLFQAVFLTLVTFLYRRAGRKIRFEAVVYLLISLAPYVLFAPKPAAGALPVDNAYLLRGIAAAVTGAFTYFCFKSVYSLIFKLERCRLRKDELISLAAVYAVCGTGMYSVLGRTFYLCFVALATVFAVRLTRSPAAFISALALSVPPAACELSLTPVTVNVCITLLTLIFAGTGRLGAGIVCGAATAAYMYVTDCFKTPPALIALYVVLLILGCALPSLNGDESYLRLKMRLEVRDVLPELAVSRSRRRTGEKLYRISEVFREIECAFCALDEDIGDDSAKGRMLAELKEKCCAGCERENRCARSSVYGGFAKLIENGCIKGRVNLIDLPSEMTSVCSRPSDVLAELNRILAEYRRCMTEKENARSGRRLLAEQAHGVAEVMKGCAVELSRSGQFQGIAENVKKVLAESGFSCPEVYIDGENGSDVCVVAVGRVNIKSMGAVISRCLKRKYLLKDKLQFDDRKTCLVFGAPPRLDAAFGVAYAIKNGEKVSGDTHSVIRINERAFLMALSDGMGSGEYAQKVSQAAISLIEAFYRAEMPEDTVLNTVNKLLSFNRDERFACIDVAAVNLDSGRADFVKIGSPAGIILREGEIKIFESQSLPLGILENLRPTVCSERLKDGDMVVFMSDGITSAFPSATDLYEYLQSLSPLNPQTLADGILAEAMSRSNHKVSDDMTVLCTRIFDNA